MPADERDAPPSLKDLARRLGEAQARQTGRSERPVDQAQASGMAIGMRIAVELAAALLVGVGIGVVLDGWLGTRPWLLIVFFVLGTAAGFMNLYRTAQELDRQARERRAAERDDNQRH